MYKLEILTINGNADLKYFSAWLESNYAASFKGFTVGSKVIIYFNPEPTAADKTTIEYYYSGLTVADVEPEAVMIPVYEQSEIDGREYFKLAKAKYFGIKFKTGELTPTNIDYIYTKLEKVVNRLTNGDWEPALYVLQNELNTISQNDIDNGYTQFLHDEIINDLETYINN